MIQRVGVLAPCEAFDSADGIETGIEFAEKRYTYMIWGNMLAERPEVVVYEMHIQINVPSSCLRWQVSFGPFAS